MAWTEEELFHETVVVPRRAFVPLPDTRIVERDGWFQLITPSLVAGGLNEVAFSRLDEAEVDAIIDRTFAEYRTAGVKFRWVTGPDTRPRDLSRRLVARGLQPQTVRAMYREWDGTTPRAGSRITVEAASRENVAVLTEVMARGWDMDPAPLAAHHEKILAEPEHGNRLFLARVDGQPAATAGLVLFPRSAYLVGGVVLPEYRGLGVYRALVAERARHAAAHGITLLTSQARAGTSAPILARAGFATVCDLTFHLSE